MEANTLIPYIENSRSLIEGQGSKPNRVKEDMFEAKNSPNVPERKKTIVDSHRSA